MYNITMNNNLYLGAGGKGHEISLHYHLHTVHGLLNK